jgi:SpoVK/Ycf46/Vps4 family AAA+-type ATPase
MNNRISKKTNKPTFRSSTDVNNYNKFLLDLDQTQRKEEKETNKINIVYAKNVTSDYTKIIDYLKYIEKEYDTYKSSINQPIVSNEMGIDPNRLAFICDKKRNLEKERSEEERKRDLEKEISEEQRKRDLENDEKREKRKVNIQFEINNVSDLLKMIEEYPDDKDIEYNIDMRSLHKIKEPLIDLNSMIGMQNVKENIVDQILFYIQNLHKPCQNQESNKKQAVYNDFMHTVIYGPPGTGKTEIAKIIGSIFSKLGILTKGTFKKVTRSDLVAGYLGQTAIKTKDVIKECLGGVLFIDEAYALGNQEKRDSFSKECIDTLCEALSDYKDNLMVIIAGYETDLNDCFFKYNQGLTSRFTWRFKIDDYNAAELYNIFIKKINDSGWILDNSNINVNVKWFEKNKGLFKFYGRDIETLFAKTKIAHSRRVFCLDVNLKKILTIADIDKGLEIYVKNGIKKDEDDENRKKLFSSMYS